MKQIIPEKSSEKVAKFLKKNIKKQQGFLEKKEKIKNLNFLNLYLL